MKPILHGVGAYGSGAIIGPAKWAYYDLIVTLEGSVVFTIGDEAFSSVAGDGFLIPPFHGFQGVAGQSGATIWVQHFRRKKPRASVSGSLPCRPTLWPGVAKAEWPRALMKQISQVHRTSSETVSLLLILLIQEFQMSDTVTPTRKDSAALAIRSTIAWLETQDFPLPSLKEMARHAGWSVSHFRDKFRATEDRPVGELIKGLQMREAARLLAETTLPIKAIAVRLGYSDTVAFHRAFLRCRMTTPGDFRCSAPRVF